MPRCPKGRCRFFCETSRQFAEHMRSHRKPTRRIEPEIHICDKCGRKMPTAFSHYNRCP